MFSLPLFLLHTDERGFVPKGCLMIILADQVKYTILVKSCLTGTRTEMLALDCFLLVSDFITCLCLQVLSTSEVPSTSKKCESHTLLCQGL